jgi:hypothetical protein
MVNGDRRASVPHASSIDRVSQRCEKENATMNTFVEQRRGSIRENRTFWLAALLVLAIGIAAIALTWAAAGVTIAATVMLLQLGVALAAGFR